MQRPSRLPLAAAPLTAILLAAVLAASAPGAAIAAPRGGSPVASPHGLQMPGDFHHDEPVARSGQTWLAMRRAGHGQVELEAVRLRVSAIEDPLGDAPGEKTGRRVEAAGGKTTDREIVAFLRGPGLHDGAVPSAIVETFKLPGLPDADILQAETRYQLRTECAPFVPTGDGSGMSHSPECRILLRQGNASTALMATSATRMRQEDGTEVTSLGDDASPHLFFAGDLDRDGKLDLIFDTTDHYNVSRPTLFLSGAVASGAGLSDAELSEAGLLPTDPAGPDLPSSGQTRPADGGTSPPKTAPLLRAVAIYRTTGC